MSLREAAQQALEALEERYVGALRDKAMDALRTALAIPGNDYERGFVDGMSHQAKSSVDRAVNAMARKPLTDEEIDLLAAKHAPPIDPDFGDDDWIGFARAIERAHGIGGEA